MLKIFSSIALLIKTVVLILLLPVFVFTLLADVFKHMASNYSDHGEMVLTSRLFNAVLDA